MLTSITSAVGAIKGLTDLLKSTNDLKSAAEINAMKIEMQQLIIELQGNLLDMQLESQSLQDKLDCYKKKIDELSSFAEEKKNYVQTKLSTGAVIFRAIDQSHDLCPLCFNINKKSILQPKGYLDSFEISECLDCKSIIRYKHLEETAEFISMERRNFWD